MQVIKHVESAIYQANIPGMTPQRVDNQTLKIPVSRSVRRSHPPTVRSSASYR